MRPVCFLQDFECLSLLISPKPLLLLSSKLSKLGINFATQLRRAQFHLETLHDLKSKFVLRWNHIYFCRVWGCTDDFEFCHCCSMNYEGLVDRSPYTCDPKQYLFHHVLKGSRRHCALTGHDLEVNECSNPLDPPQLITWAEQNTI